jgi:5'-nucleotidase
VRGPLRALITNDDGIASEGLRQLALLAVEVGLDVTVAAPSSDSSGASASLSAMQVEGRVMVEERRLPGLIDVPTFAVGAAPAFITLIATGGAFGPPPDVVLSGINYGENAGLAVLHSGTVGAALTGASRGCRALAVSIVAGSPPHWDAAVRVARQVLPSLLAAPPGTVVNLNAPDAAADQVRGLRRARLARFGAVQTNLADVGGGFARIELLDVDIEHQPDTDAALLADGWATLTELHPICEASCARLQQIDLITPGPGDAQRERWLTPVAPKMR